MNNETLRRIRRAINSIQDPGARAEALAAFREEFPEHRWFTQGERVTGAEGVYRGVERW